MERHAEARRNPASILPEVRSVVMVALEYGDLRGRESATTETKEVVAGKIARYARGPDYHAILRSKLKELLCWVQTCRPECHGRAVVDTAPLLEQRFRAASGARLDRQKHDAHQQASR